MAPRHACGVARQHAVRENGVPPRSRLLKLLAPGALGIQRIITFLHFQLRAKQPKLGIQRNPQNPHTQAHVSDTQHTTAVLT